MGSYLSEPLCEKISTDEDNDKLSYGASSMQGWRLSQEDAHNSILDFDTNSSFFAVYDGHGGHEVAQYCAEKLPDFFRTLDVYRSGDIEKALIDAFLGFDATITSADVIAELRQIASLKSDNEEDSDEDDENVSQLNQEAVMPLEEVMEKYTAVGSGKLAVAALKEGAGIQPVSPFLKARKSKDGAGGSSSSHIAIFKKSSEDTPNSEKAGSSRDESTSSAAKNGDTGHGHVNKDDAIPETTKNTEDSVAKETTEPEKNGVEVPEIKVTEPENSEDAKAEVPKVDDFKVAQEYQNGELQTPENKCEANTNTEISSTVVQENGDVTKKGKGKALAKTKGACPSVEKKSRPKRTSRQMYRKLLEYEDESADSDDEEDQTFTVMDDNSDDSEQDVSNIAIGLEEDTSDENEEDADDEDEDIDYDDEEDGGEGDCDLFMNNMKSGPGSDSGCTAVVALLIGNELYVANAGDSRCIVCRDGKAVEMSFDHKPEDATERARVEKAGGRVTYDGRINNGLNLSRAIGDHAYKLNSDLSDREQMITALPDIKRLTVKPGRDEFMVLACDGIWNYMSSEEVVEFVRTRLRAEDRPKKLSHICEEMFDHCLAPNTMGDGTGCDNMTGIIVEFKPALAGETLAPVGNLKRASSPTPDEPSKRPKTDLPPTESNAPGKTGDGTIASEMVAPEDPTAAAV